MDEDLEEVLRYVEKKTEQIKKNWRSFLLLEQCLEEKAIRGTAQARPETDDHCVLYLFSP